MADKKYPLSIIIRAVDKASVPIRGMAARLKSLQKATEPFRKVGGAFGNVGKEAFALGAKFAAMASVAAFALFRIVRGAVDAGDKLGEMADRVGLSVDAYASLQHAAAQADVDQEAFNGAMDQFNKRLGEAKAGTGGMLAFLKKVSPVFAQQVKSAGSTEMALSLVTDAMARIEDPGKRAALAAAAFGKSGLQMGNFLKQGSAAIQKQQLRYMELSGSQEEFARNAGDLDNAMRETEVAFLGVRNAIAGALFPAFKLIAVEVTKFLAQNRDGLRKWAETSGAAIRAWVAGGGIQRLAEGFRTFFNVVARVVDAIGGFKGALVVIGLIMAGPLIGSIVTLVTTIGWIGVAFVAAAAVVIAAWEPIKTFFQSLWETVNRPLEALKVARQFWGLGGQGGFNGPGGSASVVGGAALGAAGARPGRANGSKVSVDFANVPKGVRVTADKSVSTDVDYSLGPSMVTP